MNSPMIDEFAEIQNTLVLDAREEGLEAGREEGLEAGRVEGEAMLLLRMLNNKFGSINEAMTMRVKALNEEQIEELALQMFIMHDSAELAQWLLPDAGE